MKLLLAVESELGSEVNGGDVPFAIYFLSFYYVKRSFSNDFSPWQFSVGSICETLDHIFIFKVICCDIFEQQQLIHIQQFMLITKYKI